jgi:hypothetical protein
MMIWFWKEATNDCGIIPLCFGGPRKIMKTSFEIETEELTNTSVEPNYKINPSFATTTKTCFI